MAGLLLRSFVAVLFLLIAVSARAGSSMEQEGPRPLVLPGEPMPMDQAIGQLYQDIVKSYAKGEHEASVKALGSWTTPMIESLLRLIDKAAKAGRRCPNCSLPQPFGTIPLRAAILLEADREILDKIERPLSEQPSRCGVGLHATGVDGLTTILLVQDPSASAFVRQVYLAISRHAQWAHCVLGAQVWARKGLRKFPDDAPLLFAFAIAMEARAFFTAAPAANTAGLPTRAVKERMEMVAAHRVLWEDARRAFEDVLKVQPEHLEARLRLGRVLWRLGRLDDSIRCFETVLGKNSDSGLGYLAHLFLGRVLEDKKRLPEAEQHYRAALALQPLSEATATALSHVRLLQGEDDDARKILISGMLAVRLRTDFDPWVPYEITQTPEGELMLADLRRSVRP